MNRNLVILLLIYLVILVKYINFKKKQKKTFNLYGEEPTQKERRQEKAYLTLLTPIIGAAIAMLFIGLNFLYENISNFNLKNQKIEETLDYEVQYYESGRVKNYSDLMQEASYKDESNFPNIYMYTRKIEEIINNSKTSEEIEEITGYFEAVQTDLSVEKLNKNKTKNDFKNINKIEAKLQKLSKEIEKLEQKGEIK